MEFLKGVVTAGMWGCLISLVLGLLWASLVAIGGEGSIVGFLLGVAVMSLLVAVWVVPIALFFGLLYAVIRRAVRIERGRDISASS